MDDDSGYDYADGVLEIRDKNADIFEHHNPTVIASGLVKSIHDKDKRTNNTFNSRYLKSFFDRAERDRAELDFKNRNRVRSLYITPKYYDDDTEPGFQLAFVDNKSNNSFVETNYPRGRGNSMRHTLSTLRTSALERVKEVEKEEKRVQERLKEVEREKKRALEELEDVEKAHKRARK